MGLTSSKEDELRALKEVEYNAPDGLFDDAAAGKPPPLPLLETEDAELRMHVFRNVLAALVTQHVFLCICALVGVQLANMDLDLPTYVCPASMAAVAVVYFPMWGKATRWPLNLYFFVIFTAALGSYLVISVAQVNGKHILANLIFQFTLGWIFMLLYSMPSFWCDMSLFDIKSYGVYGYATMLLLAATIGWKAALMITPGNVLHASIPVVGGGLYMLGALLSVRQALGYFYSDFIMAIVIYPWAYPVDWLWRSTQHFSRSYVYAI